jgi:hypothetical protein
VCIHRGKSRTSAESGAQMPLVHNFMLCGLSEIPLLSAGNVSPDEGTTLWSVGATGSLFHSSPRFFFIFLSIYGSTRNLSLLPLRKPNLVLCHWKCGSLTLIHLRSNLDFQTTLRVWPSARVLAKSNPPLSTIFYHTAGCAAVESFSMNSNLCPKPSSSSPRTRTQYPSHPMSTYKTLKDTFHPSTRLQELAAKSAIRTEMELHQ